MDILQYHFAGLNYAWVGPTPRENVSSLSAPRISAIRVVPPIIQLAISFPRGLLPVCHSHSRTKNSLC